MLHTNPVMETHLYYSNTIHAGEAVLPAEESRHCIKVLRQTTGDEILVTDGKGTLYRCRLINEDPRKTLVGIISEEKDSSSRDYKLHIGIAPTKNISRLEWFLEKCTEIGIDTITPVICEHSERKIVKKDRMERIILSAAKQSFKPTFPLINNSVPFNDILKFAGTDEKYIAYLDPQNKDSLKSKYSGGKDVLILVGPEGDFSEKEVYMAREAGFTPVTLGPYRLRTETAGVVACHTVSILNQ